MTSLESFIIFGNKNSHSHYYSYDFNFITNHIPTLFPNHGSGFKRLSLGEENINCCKKDKPKTNGTRIIEFQIPLPLSCFGFHVSNVLLLRCSNPLYGKFYGEK